MNLKTDIRACGDLNGACYVLKVKDLIVKVIWDYDKELYQVVFNNGKNKLTLNLTPMELPQMQDLFNDLLTISRYITLQRENYHGNPTIRAILRNKPKPWLDEFE